MATGNRRGSQGRPPARSSGRGGSSRGRKPKRQSPIPTPTIGLILIGVGIMLFFCLVSPTNATVIVAVRSFINGTFGKLGAIVCILTVVGGLQMGFGDRWPLPRVLWVQAALLTVCLATILQVFRMDDLLRALRVEGYVENYNGFLWKSYDASRNVALGGGSLGAILGFPMGQYLDVVGSVMILIITMIGIVLWMLSTLMPGFGDRVADWFGQVRTDMAERREERAAQREAERQDMEREEAERGKHGEVFLPTDMFGEEDEDGVPRINPATKKKRVARPAKRPAAPPLEEDDWLDPDIGSGQDWQAEFEWEPETRKSDRRPAPRPVAKRPSAPPPVEVRPPEPVWEEPEAWQDEGAWDEPAWEPEAYAEPPRQAPPRMPANSRPVPPVKRNTQLYIENSAPPPRDAAYSEYDAERAKYATRPARKDEGAIPDYIVKRRTQIDEDYGPVQTHPRAEPSRQIPEDMDSPGRTYYERMQAAKEGLSEWKPPARFTAEPMAIVPEAVQAEPEAEEAPPERIVPKRDLSVSRILDREPQLDPETRLDRPDWKAPEPVAPAPPEPEADAYRKPPFSLLVRDERRTQVDTREADARGSQKLEETLQSFGVAAKVIKVVHGPAITRFELQPAPGVKVSKIVGLTDDIALNMAAVGVRIEAPIPGKAAIGIEIANKETQTVHLREVLESEESVRNPSRLAVALGKDIAGKSIIADLAKMPHLLIAGQTGAGKSVCINTIIASIMYRATPDEVRMILIDPKKVELAAYNGVPHLLVPVVTDPKKASGALNWAVMEMDERYRLFAEVGVRDIKGYNQRRDAETPLMPQIVVIIDELSDLMLVAPGEVEEAICRLAQLARACGIHLVVATQRPSVNVITGIIKANIPSRIAFEVSSQVDSRTILDSAGAEKLLGKGDMLFAPSGGGKPTRVQGCFISDDEVQRVVDYVKDRSETAYNQAVIDALDTIEEAAQASVETGDEETSDALFDQAAEMAIESGQTSISMLQRRLRIGYARAGRIVDEMARRGIIGQADGAKPREVLISREEYQMMFKK